MVLGRVHSIESFGATDGPGVRMVVFLQGCNLRCQFCHNPDTWAHTGGTEMSAAEALELFERNRAFYADGGITVSGGEPLLQLAFVCELFSLAHERGIHTCLDTSGAPYRDSRAPEFELLAGVLDLVLLDFKHATNDGYRKLTGVSNEGTLGFARWLEAHHIPMIVRHVVVPGKTDDEAELCTIAELTKQFSNVRALELLPYHTWGVKKYEALGLDYPLKGLEALSDEELARARSVVKNALQP